jgi:hypothetical protein
MLVYLDDVLIFSRSAEEHKEQVELVLKRLRGEKLFAKLSKCEFNKPSVTFLGHVVGQEGLSMERKKVECVLQCRVRQQSSRSGRFWDLPTIIVVSSKTFSQIAAPISNITRAKDAFLWSEKHDKSCAVLKHAFTTAPVVKIPYPTKPDIVKTDASMSGIGALLEQEEEDGWHAVSLHQRSYSQPRRTVLFTI